MFTPVASRIISIEPNPVFAAIIPYTVAETNAYEHLEVGQFYVGKRPPHFGKDVTGLTMTELFRRFGLRRIDFLKIDIEGGEFELFEEIPLRSVKYLSMEVHREEGSPETLLQFLEKEGFEVIMANSDLIRVHDPNSADYFYGKNLHFHPYPN